MDWFHQLLTQLEMEQAEKGGDMERFLDIHMYITSALQNDDVRTVGLHLALALLYQKVLKLLSVCICVYNICV